MSVSFKSLFEALEDPGGPWMDFGVLIMIWIWSLVFDTPISNFLLSMLILNVQRTSCSFTSYFGFWRMLEVPDLGSWFLYEYGQLSFIQMYADYLLSILILEVQGTSTSFKSWFGGVDNSGGLWLGFWILILIWIYSPSFETPMIQILALFIDFEDVTNIHVF